MTTQSSRAERLAKIAERAKSLWALPKWDVDWLLSELEAADTETAALIRDIESYVSISSEQAEIITSLRSALKEAREALRPFAQHIDATADCYGDHAVTVPNFVPGSDLVICDVSDLRRAAEVEKKLNTITTPDRCPGCNGTGHVADYVGLEMKPVQADCERCNGTGRITTQKSEDR